MKLSDAMDLGFTLVTFEPNVWLMPDGSCGCALGGAIAAVGRQDEFCEQLPRNAEYWQVSELQVVRKLWPWLTFRHIERISEFAWDIRDGHASKEQLLDYVRSIEPTEFIFDLPDISLEEQHRLEEEAARVEGELTEASGYQDPAFEVRR